MKAVAGLLTEPGCTWERNPGATEEQIQHLYDETGIPFPDRYIELLRFSNGGYGPLALFPRLLYLFSVDEVLENAQYELYRDHFQGFFFFGGNGGLEMIAFDLRNNLPWPIVTIDPIGGPESAIAISPDFDAFINAIGFEYKEPDQK